MFRGIKGFTLIELIIIIVCIGVLSFLALPQFIDISDEANQSAEEEIVGNIRTGLQLVFSQTMVNTGQGAYPNTLDEAIAGESSTVNPFFTNVLQDAYRGDDWTKDDSGDYTGPTGTVYEYDNSIGSFNPVP